MNFISNSNCEHLVTSDHLGVSNIGGLLLLPSEALDGADEEITAGMLAENVKTMVLALPELFEIAAFVERHRIVLEAEMLRLDTDLAQVATSWLYEYTDRTELCIHENYSPGVHNEAYHILMKLVDNESNSVISTWYKQARQNQQIPYRQQLILLSRVFKRLYETRNEQQSQTANNLESCQSSCVEPSPLQRTYSPIV